MVPLLEAPEPIAARSTVRSSSLGLRRLQGLEDRPGLREAQGRQRGAGSAGSAFGVQTKGMNSKRRRPGVLRGLGSSRSVCLSRAVPSACPPARTKHTLINTLEAPGTIWGQPGGGDGRWRQALSGYSLVTRACAQGHGTHSPHERCPREPGGWRAVRGTQGASPPQDGPCLRGPQKHLDAGGCPLPWQLGRPGQDRSVLRRESSCEGLPVRAPGSQEGTRRPRAWTCRLAGSPRPQPTLAQRNAKASGGRWQREFLLATK